MNMNRPQFTEHHLLHTNNAKNDTWQSRNSLVPYPQEASQKKQGVLVSQQNFPRQIHPHSSSQFPSGLPTTVPFSGSAISLNDNLKNFPKPVCSSQPLPTNTSFTIPPPLSPLCQQINTPLSALHNLGEKACNALTSSQNEQRTELNSTVCSHRTVNNQIPLPSYTLSARVPPMQSHPASQSSTNPTVGQSSNYVVNAQPFSVSGLPQANCITTTNFTAQSIAPCSINNSSRNVRFFSPDTPQTGSLPFVCSALVPPPLHSVPTPPKFCSMSAPPPLHSVPILPPQLHSTPAPPPQLHSTPAPPPQLHSTPAPPPQLHSTPAPPPSLHTTSVPTSLHSALAPPPLHSSLHHMHPFTLPASPQVNPAVISHLVSPNNYLPLPVNNSSAPQTPSFIPQASNISDSSQRVILPPAAYPHPPHSSHIPVSVALSVPSVLYNQTCFQTLHPHQMQNESQQLSNSEINCKFSTGSIDNQQEADELFIKDLLKRKITPSAIRKESTTLTIPEYRCMIKQAFTILNELSEVSENLKSLQNEEILFKCKISSALELKEKLASLCSKILDPEVVRYMQQRLRKVKKKRDYKRKQKERYLQHKREMEQNRAELHQKIDSWLEELKEKDLQQKRESEMKREADDILAEVRKKIYEGKRTLERLKILEKLRQARKDNAQQKGLFISSKSDDLFKEKVLILKKVMDRQLYDYEAEEKALSVMLETEQEGQREEEAARRLKKLNQFLEKKQKDIEECLFGKTDVPSTSDPMFFFRQHYNRGKSSIDNLLQIRHEWDVNLVPSSDENGSSIPQQWITPDTPCDKVWASSL